MEVLYDGKPEAEADIRAAAVRNKAELAEFRRRLTVPADPAARSGLAARYRNADLGRLTVNQAGDNVNFAFTAWSSDVLTHRNTDDTTSFLTVTPGIQGLEFVVGSSGGKRTLTTRDSQHEYVFVEEAP
jgi:hypothetical protein